MTGILNIIFGFSSSLLIFALFWGLNGWFQGFGWPPCSRFLMNWYSQSERGRWWGLWNISHNIGAFIIPWIVGASDNLFDANRGPVNIIFSVCNMSFIDGYYDPG